MKKLLEKFKVWHVVLAFFLIVSSAGGAALGGAETVYKHFTGYGKLEAQLVAMNEVTAKKFELMQIQYQKNNINSQIHSLKSQRSIIWKSQVLTRRENIELRQIRSEISELNAAKRDLIARERELNK